jgi:hypothetical protein
MLEACWLFLWYLGLLNPPEAVLATVVLADLRNLQTVFNTLTRFTILRKKRKIEGKCLTNKSFLRTKKTIFAYNLYNFENRCPREMLVLFIIF